MLARGYAVLGSLLLIGYSAVELQGWEFSRAVRQRPAPPIGMALVAARASSRSWWSSSSSSRSYSSSSGRSSGVSGGFGGK
jgi:hypothetical protein